MPYTQLRLGRFSQENQIYHITTVSHQRQPFFHHLQSARIVIQQLQRLQADHWVDTLAYVLMPDHLHWLLQLHTTPLSEIMRCLKGRSAHELGHPVWQANFYDHAVRDDEDLLHIARYIVANPLRAGLVKHIGDYPHWDAIWL